MKRKLQFSMVIDYKRPEYNAGPEAYFVDFESSLDL